MGRALARPTLLLFVFAGLPGATSPARAPREQAHLRSRQAPGQPKTDDQAIADGRILHRQTSGTALQPHAARPNASSYGAKAPGTHPDSSNLGAELTAAP